MFWWGPSSWINGQCSLTVSSQGGRVPASCLVPQLIHTRVPFMRRATPSWLSTSQRPHLLKPSHWTFELQHVSWREGPTNIQTIAPLPQPIRILNLTCVCGFLGPSVLTGWCYAYLAASPDSAQHSVPPVVEALHEPQPSTDLSFAYNTGWRSGSVLSDSSQCSHLCLLVHLVIALYSFSFLSPICPS